MIRWAPDGSGLDYIVTRERRLQHLAPAGEWRGSASRDGFHVRPDLQLRLVSGRRETRVGTRDIDARCSADSEL